MRKRFPITGIILSMCLLAFFKWSEGHLVEPEFEEVGIYNSTYDVEFILAKPKVVEEIQLFYNEECIIIELRDGGGMTWRSEECEPMKFVY